MPAWIRSGASVDARVVLGRVDVVGDHPRALDRRPRRADLGELALGDVGVTPDRRADGPAAQAGLVGESLDLLLAQQAGRDHGAVDRHRRCADRRVERRHALQRPGQPQPAQRVDHGLEIRVARGGQRHRDVGLGLGLQPHAHLRDDPVVGLHEERIQGRPEAAPVGVGGATSGQRTHPGPQQVPVGQHDLHAARRHEVAPVGHVRRAAVHRVADDAAPADVRDGEHERMPAALDRLVEVHPADAGLDDRVRQVLVDLQDAVHPAEPQLDRAAHARRRAAVAVVAALGVRPDGHVELVGDAHDRPDLLGRRGLHDGRRGERLIARDPVRVAELVDACVVDDDAVVTDDLAQARDGVVGKRRRALGGEEVGCGRHRPSLASRGRGRRGGVRCDPHPRRSARNAAAARAARSRWSV